MAFNTIGKYHGIAFDVLQDNTRRFLGIKQSAARSTIKAEVEWQVGGDVGNEPFLILTCAPAELRANAGQARPSDALNGVAALTSGVAHQLGLGSGRSVQAVRFQDIRKEQLEAAGAEPPELQAWAGQGSLGRFRSLRCR